jgi:hypothetical protein
MPKPTSSSRPLSEVTTFRGDAPDEPALSSESNHAPSRAGSIAVPTFSTEKAQPNEKSRELDTEVVVVDWDGADDPNNPRKYVNLI